MDNSNIQELASKLVARHVVCCVSSLIEGLIKISNEVSYKAFSNAFDTDSDELLSLCQRPDYETAAREFIFDDADVVDLEAIADENGCWDDILLEHVPEVVRKEDETADGDEPYYTYEGTTERFEDEGEAKDDAIEFSLSAIREAVWKIADNYEEICREHGLDPEYMDVLEHWVVSDWLSGKLAEKGEIIGEIAGLTVWGRCTSGQSVSCDSVIEQIASEAL